MLMLHGYLSDKRSFYYQIQELSKNGFLCIAPDMPCFGSSGMTDRPWSVGDYANWLKDFISAMDIKGAYVIAHSFGARVALKLFSQEISLCEKLLITGGAGVVKPRSPQYIRQVKRYRLIKKFFPKYAERHFGSKEYRSLSPMMKESYKLIVNEDLKGCAQKIVCPTLLIYGREDTVTPYDEEGEIFNNLIKGSKLQLIDGGHFCFSENYKNFNSLALHFLKG